MTALLRQIGYVAALMLLGAYAFIVLRGPNGWPGMMENRRKVEEMERGNEELRKKLEALKESNRRLRESPDEREMAVRENTFKQKPGETTIYLPPVSPAASKR
jgi:cell division protein FtsB